VGGNGTRANCLQACAKTLLRCTGLPCTSACCLRSLCCAVNTCLLILGVFYPNCARLWSCAQCRINAICRLSVRLACSASSAEWRALTVSLGVPSVCYRVRFPAARQAFTVMYLSTLVLIKPPGRLRRLLGCIPPRMEAFTCTGGFFLFGIAPSSAAASR
jgi:hypothetical protein